MTNYDSSFHYSHCIWVMNVDRLPFAQAPFCTVVLQLFSFPYRLIFMVSSDHSINRSRAPGLHCFSHVAQGGVTGIKRGVTCDFCNLQKIKKGAFAKFGPSKVSSYTVCYMYMYNLTLFSHRFTIHIVHCSQAQFIS